MSATLAEAAGLIARDDVDRAQRDDMFELFARYFDGVTRRRFESDLATKDWVLAA